MEGFSYFVFPTPRRLTRPNRPNVFLSGLSSKLMSWFSSLFQRRKGRGREERGQQGRNGGKLEQGREGKA